MKTLLATDTDTGVFFSLIPKNFKKCGVKNRFVEVEDDLVTFFLGKVNRDAESSTLLQTLDADCNDCFFFQRGKLVEKNGKYSRWSGHCLKQDVPTFAFPSQYSGHNCFKHRKENES